VEDEGEEAVRFDLIGGEGEFPAAEDHSGLGREDVDGFELKFKPSHFLGAIVVFLIASESLSPTVGDAAAGCETEFVTLEVTGHEAGNVTGIPVSLLPGHHGANGAFRRGGVRGEDDCIEEGEKKEGAEHGKFGSRLG